MKPITQKQAAELVGLQPRQFRDTIAPRIKRETITGANAALRYEPAAVVAALVAYRVEQVQVSQADPSDPLMGGGDSPNLERYRGFKADLEQIKLQQVRSQMIPREELETGLLQLASTLRSAGDRITREYGNPAGEILNDALDEAIGGWNSICTKSESADAESADRDGSADSDAEDPDDASVRGAGNLPAKRKVRGAALEQRKKPVRRRPA